MLATLDDAIDSVFRSSLSEKEEPDRKAANATPVIDSTNEAGPSGRKCRLLLTVNEVAEALSLGRTFVYGLVMRGDIASIKIGNRRRIPVSSLQEFVERQLSLAQRRAQGQAESVAEAQVSTPANRVPTTNTAKGVGEL